MNDLRERKRKANVLRKAGKFGEALVLYRDLWKETQDSFDGAGLLHCLRKLELWDEAIPFARKLVIQHRQANWCCNEVIWTLISGQLQELEEKEPLARVVDIASEIMNLKPESLAAKTIIFKVLKCAKHHNDWKTVNEWIVRIEPDCLSTEPMTDSSGRKGWCDQSLWYNYRLNGLLKDGGKEGAQEAIRIVDEIVERFPRESKFFLRLAAMANHQLGNLSEAEKLYKGLCMGNKADWWMLHEYGKVVRDVGRKGDALKLMYKAATRHRRLEAMVSLFANIGMLCQSMGKKDEARAHLLLCKYVREENLWSMPGLLDSAIDELNRTIADNTRPMSLKEALAVCRRYWKELLGEGSIPQKVSRDNRTARKGLLGTLNLGTSERIFCFIVGTNNESFCCSKKDLPLQIRDRNQVVFDAVPSFDKKKGKNSWKAVNIRVHK